MNNYPTYTDYNPAIRAYLPAADRKGCFHRFFDTNPFSPSGRYLALLQIPFEDRINESGETAGVIVIDLEGEVSWEVARTAGWEFQMGANINWGDSDDILLYNDIHEETWTSLGVRLNWKTGEKTVFPRGIYQASPDGTQAAVTNLTAMRRTQLGYGVVIPDEMVPVNQGISDEDGLFITDVVTGKSNLVASIRKFVLEGVPKEERAAFEEMQNYGFHCKWNLQGDRLIFSLRRKPREVSEGFGAMNSKEPILFDVFTCRPDGSEIHRAVPWQEWEKGGNHINFFPSGDKLSMNLKYRRKGHVLMQVNIDGSGYRPITEAVPGSGHPIVHPDGRHIIADTYVHESAQFGGNDYPEGYTPIRWIDLERGNEEALVWIPTATPGQKGNSSLRVDPHVINSPDWTRALVNTFLGGTRQPMILELESL